jgi:hypothetical protein
MASVETEPLLYLDGEDYTKPGEDLTIIVTKEFLTEEHVADPPAQQNNIDHYLLGCFLLTSSYVVYLVPMISNRLFDFIVQTVWLLNNLGRRLYHFFYLDENCPFYDIIRNETTD